jgi:hypothetical protein
MASLVQNNNEHSLTSPAQKSTGEFGEFGEFVTRACG